MTTAGGGPCPATPLSGGPAGNGIPRPRSVDRAVLVWLAFLGMQLIEAIVGLVAHTQTPGSAGLIVLLEVVVLALVVRMRSGARWARTILTVITVLDLLGGVAETTRYGLGAWLPVTVSPTLAVLLLTLSVGETVLMVAAVIPMFTSAAAAYFELGQPARR